MVSWPIYVCMWRMHSTHHGVTIMTTSVFKYYFSNTWTGLDYSGVSLCSLGVEIELFSYMNHGSCSGPLIYNGILNPLCTVSEFCLDSINPLTIQFQYLELFSPFLLIVRYPAGDRKWVILFGALNHFKNMTRLSISLIIWLLGFSIADIIDSSFNDTVVDLLSGGGREGSCCNLKEYLKLQHSSKDSRMNWE